MTTAEDRKQEFFDDCLEETDGQKGAVRVDGTIDRKRRAKRFSEQSDYHRLAADDLLEGKATLLAIKEGYYAMLHKANEALVLGGFEAKSHHCTLMGLRGIFDAPDLADTLRRARRERKNVDYGMNPDDPSMEEFSDPKHFVETVTDPFLDDVDELVESRLD